MQDVSVVMAVFNSRHLLIDSVASVLAQDGCAFELILVDDGSTDGSGWLCDRFAEVDRRIRVIHQDRGGMCRARNHAIEQSHGNYIAFCDNDDLYLPSLLADNLALALEEGADCVRFGRVSEKRDEYGRRYDISEAMPSRRACLRGGQIFERYRELRFGSEGVWNGLYNRQFLMDEDIRFDERLHHGCEDVLFNNHVFDAASCVVLNPETYYQWIRRVDHSASFSFGENYYLGVRLALDSEYDLMVRHGVREQDPSVFARRMMSYLRGGIGTLVTGRHPSYQEQYDLFEAYRRLYAPFAGELESCVGHTDASLLSLLMQRRYVLLSCGVRAAGMLARAQHQRTGLSKRTLIRMCEDMRR